MKNYRRYRRDGCLARRAPALRRAVAPWHRPRRDGCRMFERAREASRRLPVDDRGLRALLTVDLFWCLGYLGILIHSRLAGLRRGDGR